MKRKLSLKTRLMLTTSILLVAVSIIFTLFSILNAYVNMVRPLEEYYTIQFGTPHPDIIIQADHFFHASMLFLVIAIVIGCFLTYLVAKFSLKPLKIWSQQMSAIDQNQLSTRIENANTQDELDTLADSFNLLLERLQNAFDREKRFSSAAAHELKTPLSVIKASIDFLQLEDEPKLEEYQESIQIIQKQNERMINLVDDLMLMNTANQNTKVEIIDVDTMIREIENELKLEMETKHISFEYHKAGFQLKGNATLIKHAFSNLVQNAIKYNVENGKIMLSQKKENAQYLFLISDTGIGINKEDAPYIFEPFYRSSKSRSRKEGGSGLGLAITKEIIESHYGSVEYHENQPQGSEFLIKLPTK